MRTHNEAPFSHGRVTRAYKHDDDAPVESVRSGRNMILLLLCLELGVPALGKGTYPYPHNYPGQGNTYNSLAYYQQLSPRRYAVNYQQQQPRVSKLRPSGTKLYQSYAVPPATNRYLPKVSHKRDVVLFTSPEFSYQYDTTGDPDKLRWASAALKENRIKLGASSLYNYRVIPKTSSLLGPTPVVRAVISPVTGARLPPPRRPPAAVRATAPAATPKSPLTYGVSFGAGVNPGSRLGAASSLSSPVKIFSAPVKTSDLGSSREPFGVTSFSSVTSSSPQTKKSRSKASSTKSSKPFGTAFSSRLTGRTLRQQPRLSAATATPAKTSSRPVARLSERQPYGVTFAALPPLHAQSPEKLVDGVTMSLGEATALSNNGEDSYASLVRSRAKVTRVGSGDSADTSTILKSLLSEKQKVFPNEGIGKAAEDQESRKPKTFIQRVRPGKSESLTAASKLAKTSPPQPGAEKVLLLPPGVGGCGCLPVRVLVASDLLSSSAVSPQTLYLLCHETEKLSLHYGLNLGLWISFQTHLC